MHNIEAILTSNIIGAILMIIVLISSGKTRRASLPDEHIFKLLVISTLIMCIIEPLAFVIDKAQFPGAILLNRLANSALYMFDVVPPILWFVYVDYKVFESREHMRKTFPIYFIPAIIMMILAILNIFFDIFFTVSDENVYSRLPLCYVFVAIGLAYFFAAMVLLVVKRERLHRYFFMPMFLFFFFPVVGTINQTIFYGISLMWVATAISIIIVYLNVQKEAAATDTLTGLYSRMRLDHYLKSECSLHRLETIPLVGLMLDVDKFKSINDTYGHAAGDDALECVGKILRDSCDIKTFIARYAGDEFMVIFRASDSEKINLNIDRILRRTDDFNKTAGKPYKLSFSIGTAIFGAVKDDTVDKFLKRMDVAMYKDKARVLN